MNLTLHASDNFKVERLDNAMMTSGLKLIKMKSTISNERDKRELQEKRTENNLQDNMDCLVSLGGEVLSQFRFDRGPLSLSKHSLNILAQLSHAS